MKNFSLFAFLFFVLSAKAQSNFIGAGVALNFTGNPNCYIDLGDVYNDLNFPYSFEAWIKPEGFPPIWAGLFTTDNSLDLYYGSYIRISSTGQVEIEFGDGLGNGQADRRGIITLDPLILHQWTHVAVVANSVTDLAIYFNGVKMAAVPTDGGSGSTLFTHSSAPASIGRMIDIYAEHDFNGAMDEVRLWNKGLSETEIRNSMCHKLSGNKPGLIGYWQADESYTGNTVLDKTVPAENGTLMGQTTKVTSGAPVGDVSSYVYTDNWSNVSAMISSPGWDGFLVGNVSNNPYGIQVYRVDASPYSENGLSDHADFYFGVFTADNSAKASYSCAYHYSFSDGLADSANEANLALYNRVDATSPEWVDLKALRPDTGQRLEQIGLPSPQEFILNVNEGASVATLSTNVDGQNIVIYPNPFSDQLRIEHLNKSWKDISITDELGRRILSINPADAPSELTIPTANWSSGNYFLLVNTGNKIFSQKLVSQK